MSSRGASRRSSTRRSTYSHIVTMDRSVEVRFFCETRVDLVWEDTFRWLKRAGMHLVFLGMIAVSGLMTGKVLPGLRHNALRRARGLEGG